MFRVAMLVLFFACSNLIAGDWPQFLGPNRNNRSTEIVKPWQGELKPLWEVPIGPAHSSPVVVGEMVYAYYEIKGKNVDALAAHDIKTGKQLWESFYEREEFKPPFGNGPRGTPVVDAGFVYTLGGTGVLACWNAKSGEIKWIVDTLKDFKVENLPFGVSGTPLVFDGKVFINVGGKGAGVVAFACDSGKVVWQKSDDGMSYSSGIVAKINNQDCVIFLTKQHLLILDAKTGEEISKVPFKDQLSESATSPLMMDNKKLIASSVTLGSLALDFTQATPSKAWMKPELNCYFSTPVAVKDDLFMLNGVLSISPAITLRCVDSETGKIYWEKANVGKYHAAIIQTADDKLLMLDDGGTLVLFDASNKKYNELAKSKVCGPTWAHPALSNGILFLRDEKKMLAIEMPK